MTTISRNQAGAIGQQASPLTYTGSFSDISPADQTATVIVAPASNVNGLYVEIVGVTAFSNAASTFTDVTILAKTTAPANNQDGDVICRICAGGLSGYITNQQQAIRVKVPAGKGLYLNQKSFGGSTPGICSKNILYTIL